MVKDACVLNGMIDFLHMLLCLAIPEASPVFFACWCMLAQGACLDSGVIVGRHRIVTAGLRSLAG